MHSRHLRQLQYFNGWIRSIRKNKLYTFVEVSNGKKDVQLVIDKSRKIENLAIGASLSCNGNFQLKENGQMDIHVQDIKIIGTCDPQTYPLQNQRHSLEFLRKMPHLIARRKLQATIINYRHFLSTEIHKYFDSLEFTHVNTPILTSNDCEGGGSTLKVSNDMFKSLANLTVSAQLHLEAINSGFEKVYTLGPCFRAERTTSSKHLAEFYMLEAEIAFMDDLETLLSLVEKFFNHLISISKVYLDPKMDQLQSEIELMPSNRLKVAKIERITYNNAFELLKTKNKNYEHPLTFGDFTNEQEQHLVSIIGGPVFVTHYPSSNKPFYMKSIDGKAICFDFLVPHVGEMAGGSLRSLELNNLPSNLNWYNDLRQFGASPHCGFGFGLERFIMYAMNLKSIRDTIPFPRYYKSTIF